MTSKDRSEKAMQHLPGSVVRLALRKAKCHERSSTTLRPPSERGYMEALKSTAWFNSYPKASIN